MKTKNTKEHNSFLKTILFLKSKGIPINDDGTFSTLPIDEEISDLTMFLLSMLKPLSKTDLIVPTV